MKTFNFSTMAHSPAPANEIEQVINSLNGLMRQRAVTICVRHVTSTAGVKAAQKASAIPHVQTSSAYGRNAMTAA